MFNLSSILVYGFLALQYSAVLSTNEGIINTQFLMDGNSAEKMCMAGTCGVRCNLDKVELSPNDTANVTFNNCLNLTRVTIDLISQELIRFEANINEGLQWSFNQDFNQTFMCVTSLHLLFLVERTEKIGWIEFGTSSSPCNTTTTTTTTIKHEKSTEISNTDTTSETGTTIHPTVGTEETNETTLSGESSPNIQAVITGASAAIGSLLLLIATAIIVLTLVLWIRRKKASSLSTYRVSNNYETTTGSTARITVPARGLHPNMENTDGSALMEIHPPEWATYPSLPRPPIDPALATIEEWKGNAPPPVNNLHYASSLSITSNSNMSEPPDYESIKDVRSKYFLPAQDGVSFPPSPLTRGSKQHTRSLQDFHLVHREHQWTNSVDRVRIKQDMAGSNKKMALLLEEETALGVSPPTDARQFPYGFDDETYESMGTGGAMSINNDLYEATSSGVVKTADCENLYENSDQCPTSTQNNENHPISPLLATSPVYTTMDSIPLSQRSEEGAVEMLPGTVPRQETPGYSKVNKSMRKTLTRSATADSSSPPPIPPTLADADADAGNYTADSPPPPPVPPYLADSGTVNNNPDVMETEENSYLVVLT